ncbi:KCP-like protein, partial [Mya arenaria]
MKMNVFGCILWNAILITAGTLPLVRAVGGISFHCLQPLKIGPCLGKFQRFFFNTSSLQCEVFAWGGCFGGQNNFETYDSCLRECACGLPKDGGPCFGSSPSWFHEDGTCKQFVWRGQEQTAVTKNFSHEDPVVTRATRLIQQSRDKC